MALRFPRFTLSGALRFRIAITLLYPSDPAVCLS